MSVAMKRKSDNDEASSASKKPPRQDPVSCQTCRKRKLKCDRKSPCGSCSARRLQCLYASPTSENVQTRRIENIESPAKAQNLGDVVRESHPSPTREQVPSAIVPPSIGTREKSVNVDSDFRPNDESVATVERLETIVMGHWVPNAVPTVHRDEFTTPGQTPMTAAGHIAAEGDQVILTENPNTIHLPSYLPPWAEAMCMFRYYCDHIDFQYHVILPSRTEQQIQGIYNAVSRQEQIDLGHTALLFSIIASTAYYKLRCESSDHRSQTAAFLAGAALIQSNHIAYPTLEGLQATMVIGHCLSNTTLPSAVSSLFVHRLFLNQAVNMELHLLDCPRFGNERVSDGPERATLELKRRLWWDLVAYDWLLSYLSGPQQWTYTVNPHQMNVHLPLNIEDSALSNNTSTSTNGQPLSTPTAMSYSLCRLRLATVSREIADSYADQVFHDREMSYESILQLDRKLRDSLSDLPEYFRFGQTAQREYAELYRERPAFAWQRSMLVLGYHFRLCRLHRRFFVRGAKDPKYSYSHVICLQSARTVLEVKRIMDEEEPVFAPSSSLIWAVMHHVFVAAVILLVDLCFNWEDVLAEKRKEEVLAACRLLTRAQQSSDVAHRAVDAMMEVLRKYWKCNKGPACRAADQQPATSSGLQDPANALPTPMTTADNTGPYNPPLADPQPDPFDAPFDLWTDMIDGTTNPSLNTPDWTDLLTELTNAPFPIE